MTPNERERYKWTVEIDSEVMMCHGVRKFAEFLADRGYPIEYALDCLRERTRKLAVLEKSAKGNVRHA